jgi:hypothetical protein
MLWGLQIKLRRKIAIFGIFGLGILSVAGMDLSPDVATPEACKLTVFLAGCVRFSYVRLLAAEKDMYFYLADSLNWCSIEIYVGEFLLLDLVMRAHPADHVCRVILAILCGSAPSLRILLKGPFARIFGSSYGESEGGKKKSESYQLGTGNQPWKKNPPHKLGRNMVTDISLGPTRKDSEEAIIPSGSNVGETAARSDGGSFQSESRGKPPEDH